MLSLEGNPLILTKNYAHIVQERLPELKMLDGNTLFLDKKDDEKPLNGSSVFGDEPVYEY